MPRDKKKLESIFKVAPIGIGVVKDRILTEVNSRICEMIGYDYDELVGSSSRILYPNQEEYEYVGNEKYQQISENETGTVETKWKRKDGRIIDILLSSTPIDISNLSEGITFTALDITDRKQAEAELVNREQKFRALYDNAPLPYQSLDENGRFIDVNPAWLENLGYKKGEIVGRLFSELLHPDWASDFHTIFARFKLIGHGSDIQYKVRHKDGHYLHVSFEGRIGYHQDGTFKQTYCVFKDVTEQIESQEKMLMLAGVLKTSPASIIIHDFEGNILFANQRMYILHGYLESEIENLNLQLMYDPDTIRKIPERIQETKDKGTVSFEVCHIKKDGTKFPLSVSAKVIPWHGKEAILSIALDMTEQKRVENELQDASERLQLATRAGGVGVWDYDIVNNKIIYDEQMTSLYRINRDEFDNTLESWLALIHPDDRLETENAMKMALYGENEYDIEFRIVRPDDSIRNIRALATVHRDDSGIPVRMIGTNWDITAQKHAEEELRASEEKFRLLVTQMQQGMAVHEVICDESGAVVDYRFLDVNEAFEDLTGLKKESILGKTVLEVLPNIKASLIEKYGHVALTGEPLYLEDYVSELDRYYDVVAYQTVPGQFASIISDISENKKYEDAMRVIAETSSSRDEDLFAVLVHQLALSQKLYCVFISSLDTVRPDTATTLAVWMDGKLCDNFSYSLEGTPCHDVMNGEMCFYPSDIYKKFPEDHMLEEMKAESYWGTPLRDSKGKTIGLISVIDNKPLDKSSHLLSLLSSFASRAAAEMELQIAEKEIEKNEKVFKLFFDQAAVGVAQISLDGHFLRTNKRFSEITGYSVDELISANFRDITHPDDLHLEDTYIRQIMAKEMDSYEIEKRYIHKEGHIVWIKLYSNVIRGKDDSVLYATAVIVDITDQRKAEEALIYAKTIADESNRIKSEMLNNVSHELRTPLTAVIGFSDQLLHGTHNNLDEQQKTYLGYIQQSGENLLSVINRMLDFANLEHNILESLKLQPVNISNIVHDTTSVLFAKASKKNIQINTTLDHNLDTVIADKGKMESILYNLVENAIKFTDDSGTVTIRVNTGNDDTVLFSIQDTGIGIEKERLGSIFEAFIQIDGSMNRRYGGTGLGLALVRKLVEMHGGSIWVESEPWKGSKFSFRIPINPK
jgi:PAS domain S-box-containing protein